MGGTYFAFAIPSLEGAEPTTYNLAHPLSGETVAGMLSSVQLSISEALIRWLVDESQGFLPLVLRRRGLDAAGADDVNVCNLPIDVGALLFGRQSAVVRFEAAVSSEGHLAPASSEGVSFSMEGATPLPAPAAELAASLGVQITSDAPLLTHEMLTGLNPMCVTLVRADGLPSAYSGTPYKRPYEDLRDSCEPVSVHWSLLDTTCVSSAKSHAPSIRWNERKMLLAGNRIIDPAALARRLRSVQHPPFGVGRASLGDLIPRRRTDTTDYRLSGLPIHPPRRLTLELDILPCERPKAKPEPEEAAAEYHAGSYVESGTLVTVYVELASPLGAEGKPKPKAELQRMITLIRYADTPVLHALLAVVKAANDAIGMGSASAWESYKESAREDLDLVTGVHLVDGECRLFFFEGLAATAPDDPNPNAMGRLAKLLERRKPNSGTAFTLMDSSITFSERLYNTFEMPTKLIKLRQPIPALLLRPDVYRYLRVAEGTQKALLCLGCLLGSQTLRTAYKASAFPHWEHLLQLEKKFGGVQLVADREGVMLDDDDEDEPFDPMAETGAAPVKKQRHRPAARKAPTDGDNEAWYKSLEARALMQPIDYLAKNIAELPQPPPPAPLPQWYLDAIPKLEGPAYIYSGQRLNQQEQQKELLRQALIKLHKEKNIQMTYNKEFLWADSVGDREPPKPKREQIPNMKPDAHLAPWDIKQPIIHNKDGTTSSFRILQPSDYRSEELKEPWDEEELLRSQRPIQPPGPLPPGAMHHSRRWDPNPCPNDFLDEDIHERMRSVFSGMTEEQIAAEKLAAVDGAVKTWRDKLVVDDPVLRINLRSSDYASQVDKLSSVLDDRPVKKALKSLYKGKTPLKLAAEPSAFTLSVPYEEASTQGLSLTWRGSTSWKPSSDGLDVTLAATKGKSKGKKVTMSLPQSHR
ncbi:flagellar associated protein [Chrysochromulina tobinii]|uniref:Flagellar associated protein n=1 Tax=Chrysochromulina tobinii TaxID=1460289 RepID=A0A0M0JIL4_9EUKA|nr:flagellar associated protein [Chrysochromulina tobinii]|eukprot:KOO26167.1 flagellar associated protein [Chrysochromulina sp. CCMP291]